jgi:hypothetical protein
MRSRSPLDATQYGTSSDPMSSGMPATGFTSRSSAGVQRRVPLLPEVARQRRAAHAPRELDAPVARAAHERAHHLLERHRHAHRRELFHEHAVGDGLGVDEDAVAVEDDEAEGQRL